MMLQSFPSRRRLAGPLVVGIVCCWSLLSPRSSFLFCRADESDFKLLIQTMEDDVQALAHAVEERYTVRCQPELGVLRDCSGTNFHELISVLPDPKCHVMDDDGDEPGSGGLLQIPACGNRPCGALWDYTHSTVRVPLGLVGYNTTSFHPTDPAAVEMICFSSFMDQYLSVRRLDAGRSQYWSQAYFGSATGAFRIYPGRTGPISSTGYDPRRRPWFVAASSGPKNVILIIDANSVNDDDRIKQQKMKAFANRTIDLLTLADGIAVVVVTPPSSNTTTMAKYITNANDFLYNGVNEKKNLTYEIDGLWRSTTTATKTTNDAFLKAFAILDNAGDGCTSTAILFLTAGGGYHATTNDVDDPTQKSEQDVLALVKEQLAGRSKTILFTYSFGKASDDETLEDFPKQLACETKGVWSRIDDDYYDDESNPNHQMQRPYYELFALARGNAPSANFTAWVDPYVYVTGGVEGTTVSAPVYDRTRGPPLTLLGVVGMDIPMALLERTLDGDVIKTRVELQKVVGKSQQAQCPIALNWTDCQLELFRGSGANCPANCTTIAAAADDGSNTFHGLQLCTTGATADFPTALWAGVNLTLLDIDYEQRVCCKMEGDTAPTNTCGVLSTAVTVPTPSSPVLAPGNVVPMAQPVRTFAPTYFVPTAPPPIVEVISSVVGSIAAVAAVVAYIVCERRRRLERRRRREAPEVLG